MENDKVCHIFKPGSTFEIISIRLWFARIDFYSYSSGRNSSAFKDDSPYSLAVRCILVY